MFDGVPEQFHQFITPRTTSSLPLHLPIFPLHASTTTSTPNTTTTTTTFPTFDPYNNHHHSLQLQQSANLLHHPILHHGHGHHKINNEEKQEEVNNTSSSTRVVVSTMNFEIERDQREELPQLIDPWSNDEVLALLRIRSSMESWFPEFTWEHVSRKLAEVGYKRSAEKCKEKFEEETRYFNNINNFNKNNNYRFVSELEELYQGDQNTEKTTHCVEEQQDKNNNISMGHALEEDSRNDDVASVGVQKSINKNKEIKKRKRGDKKRFEVFKGFCESVVKKMMEQQEEMHNRLIEDMVKRDEEKFTREEAWKKQEMEKMNMELELMAREQAIAGDRQANIIQFLNKFKVTNNSSSSTLHSQNPNPNPNPKNPSSTLAQDTLSQQVLPPSSSNNPSSSMNEPLERNSVMISKDDIGRRWPKDEVLALINLRCTSMNNSNNNNVNGSEEKEGNKVQVVPLWERISKGMLELGYKRSAKRCKEKWENINKYFRKTKDANKKRSIDSRTCPYFHLLSTLYKQGKLVQQSEKSSESNFNNNNNNAAAAEAADHQTQAESSQVGPAGNFTMLQQQQVHHGGEKKTVFQQVPPMDFDQF